MQWCNGVLPLYRDTSGIGIVKNCQDQRNSSKHWVIIGYLVLRINVRTSIQQKPGEFESVVIRDVVERRISILKHVYVYFLKEKGKAGEIKATPCVSPDCKHSRRRQSAVAF